MVTGDTHGEPHLRFKDLLQEMKCSGEKQTLNKNDLMIVVGDFGVIWGESNPKTDRIEKSILDKLEAMPFTTLFIDGNHENFDRLMTFPEEYRYGGKVGVLRPSVLHLKQRGHVYNLDGVKVWCFGGGTSIDKYLRREGTSWWSAEDPTEYEYEHGLDQLKKNNWEVDMVITHEAPSGAMEALHLQPLTKDSLGYNPYLYDPISPYLEMVSRKLNFSKWFFGHYHKDVIDFTSETMAFSKYSEYSNYSSLYLQTIDTQISEEALQSRMPEQ